jgi:hypothetical protein
MEYEMRKYIYNLSEYLSESSDVDFYKMAKHPETQKHINSGDIMEEFWCDPKNYEENVYYRVDGAGQGYTGVGKGLYLGKDAEAIFKFYDQDAYFDEDAERLPFHKYVGNNINWWNLMDYNDFDNFKDKLKSIGEDIENSSIIGKIVMFNGYDGIRYFDPFATGEEFVLYNTSKVRKV